MRIPLFLPVLVFLWAMATESPATVVVKFDAARGSITADGTSYGAFSAYPTSYNFAGRIWSGDASTIFYFDDAITPGVLSSATTFTFPPLSQPAFTAMIPIGGAFYLQNPGTGESTTVPPLFFTGTVEASSATFTPLDENNTRFTASNSGTVAGGGTYTLTISGAYNPVSTSASLVLRLFDVDPSIYGGSTILLTEKITSVPEPQTWISLVMGAGFLSLLRLRNRRLRNRPSR